MGVFARNSLATGWPDSDLSLLFILCGCESGRNLRSAACRSAMSRPQVCRLRPCVTSETSGSDGRTLAAVIAQLAARECIQIELENGQYKLTQLKANSSTEKTLAPEESRLLELLFEDGPETIIHPSNARNLNIYLLGISGQLQKRLDGMLLHAEYRLTWPWIPGVAGISDGLWR